MPFCIAVVLVGCGPSSRDVGQATTCVSNLKSITTAFDMYATDSNGSLPPTLGTLTPDYLRSVPTCPAAGKDTYSASYQISEHHDYTLFCSGHHHGAMKMPKNHPAYTSQAGLQPGGSYFSESVGWKSSRDRGPQPVDSSL